MESEKRKNKIYVLNSHSFLERNGYKYEKIFDTYSYINYGILNEPIGIGRRYFRYRKK